MKCIWSSAFDSRGCWSPQHTTTSAWTHHSSQSWHPSMPRMQQLQLLPSLFSLSLAPSLSLGSLPPSYQGFVAAACEPSNTFGYILLLPSTPASHSPPPPTRPKSCPYLCCHTSPPQSGPACSSSTPAGAHTRTVDIVNTVALLAAVCCCCLHALSADLQTHIYTHQTPQALTADCYPCMSAAALPPHALALLSLCTCRGAAPGCR